MLKLLLALAAVGALMFWLLPGSRSGEGSVAATVHPMLHTLQKSGCGAAAMPASARSVTGAAALKELKSAIENCQKKAAARAEAPAVSP